MGLCSYLLTGQLLEAEVGSVVMFELPPGYGKRALDENFLEVRQSLTAGSMCWFHAACCVYLWLGESVRVLWIHQ